MSVVIDIESLLQPIPGENPCGLFFSASPVAESLKRARISSDPALGGEGGEAVWRAVVKECVETLSSETKDLRVAASLVEALCVTGGFPGLASGFTMLTRLLEEYWDTLHPQIEDGDLDGRALPFENLDQRVSVAAKQIPLTDPRTSAGYGYLQYEESRRTGYDNSADSEKRRRREAELEDGKIPAEEFDLAVQKSPASFYREAAREITNAIEEFGALNAAIDRTFGDDAPGLGKLGEALEGCLHLVLRICREQKGLGDVLASAEAPKPHAATSEAPPASTAPVASQGAALPQPTLPSETGSGEDQVWGEALKLLQGGSLKNGLDLLLAAANSQPSERGRCRYRFLVAKLCLKAGHPELARPIVEQLAALMEELNLERWESPFWVSEILEALHQCLTFGEDAEEEGARAREIFKKICTLDVTRALK
ncbi:type VI secretion system protein TssA [Geomonas sp. RF6]|uniref:type VI secretion system protein TssA n=1 Tax=Geomonas sp. RF6 TaxID=2897342 RepID=UPI001E5B313C|nr:type VI secretion system protein TssA [Geomonas sp. RF6]UFS70719.1 type VI secretion system protein TssA [Geomonas sp. RF6]